MSKEELLESKLLNDKIESLIETSFSLDEDNDGDLSEYCDKATLKYNILLLIKACFDTIENK